ncbi:MAG: septation regulator SpoVG [Oscillospiraceae bacterium]|nr:septation regulator SpoVG [Oscillospiraceae bacterium]MBR5722282.1 septation regulator SpoVG [Oscillospiraceae bacterium]
MEITDLKIRKMMTDGRLRAIVSITLDQMLAVHDIKVVQGETRLFVAMPSRKDEGGIFRDIVHPISAQARQYLENQILEAYQEQLALMQAEAESAAAEYSAAPAAVEAVPAEPAAPAAAL